MSDNFRQAVEEIEYDACGGGCKIPCDSKYKLGSAFNCPQCVSDRILAAHNAELDRIAEGMPTIKMPTSYECYGDREKASYFNNGIDCCQAHVKAQKEAL